MFALIFVVAIAVMIDRFCHQRRVNSVPYQFASLFLALFGQLVALVFLDELFPRPLNGLLGLSDDSLELLGMAIAGCSGGAASLLCYLYLRSRFLSDADYADPLHIADVLQPRDGNDVRPE
jgi:hypothetical protein